MLAKTRMTVEEFVLMETPETEDYELVDGELVLLHSEPQPSCVPLWHNLIRDSIGLRIANYLATNPVGQCLWVTDCRTADATVRRPDLGIYLAERFRRIDLDTSPVPFAPDIAVDVLSPSDPYVDLHRRIREYLNAGGQEVWVVDRCNKLVFVNQGSSARMLVESDVLESPLLPGFGVKVADLLVW